MISSIKFKTTPARWLQKNSVKSIVYYHTFYNEANAFHKITSLHEVRIVCPEWMVMVVYVPTYYIKPTYVLNNMKEVLTRLIN